MTYSKDRLAMLDNHLGKSEPVVKYQRKGHTGIVSLNRPKALNSLNQDMIDLLQPAFRACETDPACKIVILKGEGRAFCAGGDVVDLATAAKDSNKRHKSVKLFKGEYEGDRYIAHMKKPLISLMHGITMGGGAGLSVHGSFRVATEKTMFAMPETGIGLFPDVGANFFLPRLDGELGTYIALTSERLNGFATYQARIATHFVHSSKTEDLLEALLSLDLQNKEGASLSSSVDACIERFTCTDENTKSTLVGEKREAIDRCFKYNRMEEIVSALEKESKSTSEDSAKWAKETLKTIESKSPTSLKVTLEGLRRGKHMSINEVLQMDMEIGEMFCNADIVPDFAEGVTHLLVNKRKDRAKWNPPTIEETPDEQIKDIFFNHSRQYTQLTPPESHMQDWKEYPHSNYALPSEKKILEVANRSKGNTDEVLAWAKEHWSSKPGLEEHIKEIMSRHSK